MKTTTSMADQLILSSSVILLFQVCALYVRLDAAPLPPTRSDVASNSVHADRQHALYRRIYNDNPALFFAFTQLPAIEDEYDDYDEAVRRGNLPIETTPTQRVVRAERFSLFRAIYGIRKNYAGKIKRFNQRGIAGK